MFCQPVVGPGVRGPVYESLSLNYYVDRNFDEFTGSPFILAEASDPLIINLMIDDFRETAYEQCAKVYLVLKLRQHYFGAACSLYSIISINSLNKRKFRPEKDFSIVSWIGLGSAVTVSFDISQKDNTLLGLERAMFIINGRRLESLTPAPYHTCGWGPPHSMAYTSPWGQWGVFFLYFSFCINFFNHSLKFCRMEHFVIIWTTFASDIGLNMGTMG